MNTQDISNLDSMTEEEILQEAERRGYTIRQTNKGSRIGGSTEYDEWMNAANVRLWQLDKETP